MKKISLLYMAVLLISSHPLVNVYAQDAVLEVLGGGGIPGSTGNSVPIILRNDTYVGSCSFTLGKFTDNIIIRDVTLGDRNIVNSLQWQAFDNFGIEVQTNVDADPGIGVLVNVVFDVAADSPLDSYTLMLSGAQMTPGTIDLQFENGVFTVSHAIASVDYAGWVPGGIERAMAVELMSDRNVAGCQFELHFDTVLLTVTDVLSIPNSGWGYDWVQTDTGIQVTKTGGAALPASIGQPIAHIVFQALESASYGNYMITFDDFVVTDSADAQVASATVDGMFTVSAAILSITSGRGFPGSTANPIAIQLENNIFVDVVYLDLHFDTDILDINDVSRTDRSRECRLEVRSIDEGIRLILWHCGWQNEEKITPTSFYSIDSDTGAVFQILFDVIGDAPPGEYELNLSYVDIANPLGETFPVFMEDGIFKIPLRGDVNSDGHVDILDVVLTVNIILGIHQPTPDELFTADCNDDEEVNILDVVCIVVILMGY